MNNIKQNSALISLLQKNLKEKNKFFYFRDKYRTTKISFEQAYELGLEFAVYLREIGINKNDKVIIKTSNHYKWTLVFLGCMFSGTVLVPIDINSEFAFDERILKKIKAKLAIYSRAEVENGILCQELDIARLYIEDIEETVYDFSPSEHILNEVYDEDVAEIVFTSGTTSIPKGVVLTHRNIAFNLLAAKPIFDKWKLAFKLMLNSKILTLVPLSHMYGQVIGIFVPLIIRSSIVYFNSLNPSEILKAIKQEKIWILGILPKLLSILKNHICVTYDLNNQRFMQKYKRLRNKKWPLRAVLFFGLRIKLGVRFIAIISGGAELDPQTEDFFRCMTFSVFQGYGLTETAPLVALTDPTKNKQGSIGSFLEGLEIKVIDNETYIKGENVSSGYFEDKKMTTEVFRNGWFKTGDILEVDKDGDVYFKGRKDDVIIREDGLNVYPQDIENALNNFPEIKDSAVMEIKSNNIREIHAVLLLQDRRIESDSTVIKEIIKQANSKLNKYQHIDSFSIWNEDDFPRTSTLKPKKNLIKEKIISELKSIKEPIGTETVWTQNLDDGLGTLYTILKQLKNVKKDELKKEASLEKDLGFDSLDIVELSLALEEKYGIDSENIIISRNTTLNKINDLIKNPPTEKNKLPFYKFPYSKLFIFTRTLNQLILFPFVRILYRAKVYGRQNLSGIREPVVFVANHSSLLDAFVILYSLPLKIRAKTTTVMSIEYHFGYFFYRKGNIFRRIIEAVAFYFFVCFILNVTPLSRVYGFRQSLENIGRQIDNGWHILIFPEGSITTDGNIKEFEPGIGIILKDMSASTITIKIKGLFNILHNGILPLKHLPRRPLVKIFFGKKISIKHGTYKEIANELRNELISLED